MQINKTQNELIKDSYDKIYNTALEITKAWNSEYITLKILYELLMKSKLKKNKKLKDFVKNYNKTIDLLYKCSMSYCGNNDLNKKLPMITLKLYIDELKKGLDKAK